MIASVQLQSMNYDDEHFSPVFFRKRQEFFLDFTDDVKSEINRLNVTAPPLRPAAKTLASTSTNTSLASATIPTGASGPFRSSASVTSFPTFC